MKRVVLHDASSQQAHRTIMNNAQPLLSMRNVEKSFSGVRVLTDVMFSVKAGEVVSLLGANGAGKSTLMKIVTGNYRRDSGSIVIDSQTIDIQSPSDALAAGIRMLPQELSVFPDLTVAENIMIGAMPCSKVLGVSTVDRKAMERQASALMARMGLDSVQTGVRLGSLSHHVQRIVEIARALVGDARVLVMDEPTASLAEAEVQMLFGIIRRLKAEGISVVYISHYLNEVFAISDRIVVLRDGRNAGEFEAAGTDEDAVLEAIVGNRVGNIYPQFSTRKTASPVMDVEGLSVKGWVDDVSFTVTEGQITGAHGLIGSGTEMVGRALFGAVPGARASRIRFAGQAFDIETPGAAVDAGLGLVAAERKREGIFPMLTIRENLSVSNLKLFSNGVVVDRQAEMSAATTWLKNLSIRARNIEQHVGTLSGGNQQKVCLARWLLRELKMLILEEPTRGVDMGARQEIYRQIRNLAEKGLGIMIISSDAEEVAGLSDRSIVLADGRVSQMFEVPATAAELMTAASRAAA